MLSWRYAGLTEKIWMEPVGEAGYLYMKHFETAVSWGSKRDQGSKPVLQSPSKQTEDEGSIRCSLFRPLDMDCLVVFMSPLYRGKSGSREPPGLGSFPWRSGLPAQHHRGGWHIAEGQYRPTRHYENRCCGQGQFVISTGLSNEVGQSGFDWKQELWHFFPKLGRCLSLVCRAQLLLLFTQEFSN